MSEYMYYESLAAPAKARYLSKLQLLGLGESDDPYISQNFVDNMSLWPPIEYGHIFCYFIERPGVYTKEELLQWKSLEAYNYFLSGHVRTVLVWLVRSSNCCVVKATVNPSQRSPKDAHHAWAAVRKDGHIVAAHCTCMAGLGEGCSHIAALLFKIESAVRNGHTSRTSTLCQWNQVFTTKHEPSPVVDISFVRPKRECHCTEKCLATPKRPCIEPPSYEEQKAFIEGIQHLEPKAAIVTATIIQPNDTGSSGKVPKQLPVTITSLYDPKYSKMPHDKLMAECRRVIGSIAVTKEEADYLAECTLLQSQSLLWHEHRKGRITASHFGSVFHTSAISPSKTLIQKILQLNPIPDVPALKWGRENEPLARQQYIEAVSDQHAFFEVEETGLHINPKYPYLGASPDGLVSCSCCGDGLVEIKCPYSRRDISPTDIVDPHFYLVNTKDGMKLSRTHNYYYQIQGQMAICERSYADFVCWTPYGISIERICRDNEHFNRVKPKLDSFFVGSILPRVLRGTTEDNKENVPNNHPREYCYCRQGEFGNMIACDNPQCAYEWFHFGCVNISCAPKGNWYCPDCKVSS